MSYKGMSREQLVEICSEEFVNGALVGFSAKLPSEMSNGLIRYVLLRNILSGRVARLIYRDHAHDPAVWLQSYIPRLAQFYTHEHEQWLLWKSPDKGLQELLYRQLDFFARGHMRSLRLAAYHVDLSDITHEAYSLIGERLHRYPFDLPLLEWLDRHVGQCARSLNHLAPIHTPLLSITDFDEDYELPDVKQVSESQMTEAFIDIQQGMRTLTRENSIILRMWYYGYTLDETSKHLNLTTKAVANRRNRIHKHIREFVML